MLPPVNDTGQVHVDGGVIDNLPVRVMRRQGRGLTIAVDIDTGGALAAGAGVEESWSAWEFFRRLVWKREETLPIPSIVRILLRSALVSSAARAIEDRAAADLLIVPPMEQFDLLDWTSFDARHRARLRRHHEGARQGAQPADRRADLHRLDQERNFRLLTTLSTVLRGPWTPMPTKSSASTGAAAKAVRLSASLVVVNIASI